MENNKNNLDDVFKNFVKNETGGYQENEVVNTNKSIDIDNYKESMLYNREYISIDLNLLPAGKYYKSGTKISIRAASVGEVQEYSIVDNSNILDVTEKMNTILSKCVRLMINNQRGSYKDIKDSDRLVLIFMIRELTFQKGNNLAKDVTCKSCNNEFKIEFRTTDSENLSKTFEYINIKDDVLEFYNPSTKTIDIEIDNKLWKLSLPTIGLQEDFYNYMKNNANNKEKTPNVSFMKIIPYTLYDRSSITDNGIEEKEKQYSKLDMDTFQTLNYIVDNMKVGIKGLKSKCPVCGQEVHTNMSFPFGASGIFVVSNPLDKFKKK